jgi:small subunit ribosomal protein S18
MISPTYIAKPKACTFCKENIKYLDYKDLKTLRKFLSPYSRILGRQRTGACAKHQRALTRALKYARFMALLPYVTK